MTLSSVASALLTRRLLAVVGRAPVPQASVLCQREFASACVAPVLGVHARHIWPSLNTEQDAA